MNRPQPSAEPDLPLTNAPHCATTPEALRACHQTKDAAVRHMHGVYERLCGVPVRMRMDHVLAWNEWLCAGYDERDLRTVMNYLKEQIDLGRRNIGSLKLNNLLDVPRFEDDLQMVRMQHAACAGVRYHTGQRQRQLCRLKWRTRRINAAFCSCANGNNATAICAVTDINT